MRANGLANATRRESDRRQSLAQQRREIEARKRAAAAALREIDESATSDRVEEIRRRLDRDHPGWRERRERQPPVKPLSTDCPVCGARVPVDPVTVRTAGHPSPGRSRCRQSGVFAIDHITDGDLEGTGISRSELRGRYEQERLKGYVVGPEPRNRGGWVVSGGLPGLGHDY